MAFLLLLLLVGHACASADSATGVQGDFEPSNAGTNADTDVYVDDTTVPSAGAGSASASAAELCGGENAFCDPESIDACDQWVPEVDAAGAGGGGGAASLSTRVSGCQVVSTDGVTGTVCRVAGTGDEGAPCVSPSDCAPGLTCAGESGTSQCRPYCCSDPNRCAEGTFCALRSQRDVAATQSTVRVPVCIPPVPCALNLDEPYPCDPATDDVCSCDDGMACMVVRDGLTSCVAPGAGLDGDACPCAWGYVCSSATSTCLQLCRTSGLVAGECGDGECQASSSLPDGFGVCIGTTQDTF